MAEDVQFKVKREGTAILLADLKKMKAEKAKKTLTVFEQAVLTWYELALYRLTDQMTPADAAIVEAAALAHRDPVAQTLPAEPL